MTAKGYNSSGVIGSFSSRLLEKQNHYLTMLILFLDHDTNQLPTLLPSLAHRVGKSRTLSHRHRGYPILPLHFASP
jgi:hypothetical protein